MTTSLPLHHYPEQKNAWIKHGQCIECMDNAWPLHGCAWCFFIFLPKFLKMHAFFMVNSRAALCTFSIAKEFLLGRSMHG